MCEFCVKHGEGKKWYLNVKNYSYDLLSDVERRAFAKNHISWVNKTYKRYFNILKSLPFSTPIIGPALSAIVKRIFLYEHWGQVIPIEDVEKILNLTNSITRIPCICRKSTTGKEKRLCFLISVNPGKMGIIGVMDLSFFDGPDLAKFETFDKEQALNFFKETETKGMIHTVWTIKAPFVAVLCNCEYSTGCISMKMTKEARPLTFRAEYVAEVNADTCIGCGECVKVCQFEAIELDKKMKKIKIDPKKCYGCGICRAICKKNAIFLKDRKLVPEASVLW